MRVKVGGRWYDGKDEPILVEVNVGEREQIYNMAAGATRYCQHPAGCDPEKVRAWLRENLVEVRDPGGAPHRLVPSWADLGVEPILMRELPEPNCRRRGISG